jgi:hypothetical protein
MFDHKTCQPGNFRSVETAATVQAHWLEPEFCNIAIPFNMYVRGFALIACVKEKPIWSRSQYGWHTCHPKRRIDQDDATFNPLSQCTALRFCFAQKVAPRKGEAVVVKPINRQQPRTKADAVYVLHCFQKKSGARH